MGAEDFRYPVGSRVLVKCKGNAPATVLRHGRDSAGIYTEVQYSDGAKERLHRSNLIPGEWPLTRTSRAGEGD